RRLLNEDYPAERARRGIARTFTNEALVPELTAVEHLLPAFERFGIAASIGRVLALPGIWKKRRQHEQAARALLRQLDMTAPVDDPVSRLQRIDRKRVMLARAIAGGIVHGGFVDGG